MCTEGSKHWYAQHYCFNTNDMKLNRNSIISLLEMQHWTPGHSFIASKETSSHIGSNGSSPTDALVPERRLSPTHPHQSVDKEELLQLHPAGTPRCIKHESYGRLLTRARSVGGIKRLRARSARLLFPTLKTTTAIFAIRAMKFKVLKRIEQVDAFSSPSLFLAISASVGVRQNYSSSPFCRRRTCQPAYAHRRSPCFCESHPGHVGLSQP